MMGKFGSLIIERFACVFGGRDVIGVLRGLLSTLKTTLTIITVVVRVLSFLLGVLEDETDTDGKVPG